MDMNVSANLLQDDAPPGLFERLPETLFRPLAAQNRRLYWELLLYLYEQYFGPDAPPPEEDGWLSRRVISAIERFVSSRAWVESEDEAAPADGSTGRAYQVLRTLIDSGWLQEERVGIRIYLVMHPTVQKFLELLKQFAEEGPQLVGGKVQLIYNQLLAVRHDPVGQAVGFHEAAKAARALISTLNATNMRVREVMEQLSARQSTAEFIRAFFSDYISELYIRDYHELRTENHPLRHRFEILEIVQDLSHNTAARDALIRWYQATFRTASREQAEALFDKDINRFMLLTRIEDHLNRLDASVSRTTQRALSYIHYRIRTRDRLDRLLEQSFEALEKADAAGVVLMWPLGREPLFSEDRLREPRSAPPPVQRSPIRRAKMSIEMRAAKALRQAAQLARQVSAPELIAYVEQHVPPGVARESDQLPMRNVKEFCLFVALKRLAVVSAVTAATHYINNPLLHALTKRGISLSLVPGRYDENEYMITQKFRVQR